MPEKLKYLSGEWSREVKKRLEKGLTPEKMNNLTSSMTNLYKNCPGGTDMFFHVAFKDGAVDAVETGEGTGPPAEFLITGNYDIFAAISRAEMGSQKALMTGKLKLKGNMVKALKLASLVDRVNRIIAEIPMDFDI
ncbi:MAG: SCP2 sterol-binding domain-containing protein [Spirochaetales bacterium]|nr:SCP2 sterol-binding domain-containing protein [Spirochaetales bacterium]